MPPVCSPSAIRRSLGADDEAWDDYVRRSPGATFCHLAGWSRAVQRTWGHASHSLQAERDGVITGVLPLAHVHSHMFGSMLVSTPVAIYGGVVADDDHTRQALIAEAKRIARDLRVDYLELRDTASTGEGAFDPEFHRKDLYVTFEHHICEDEERLLESLPKKIRYGIRQAARAALSSHLGRKELLDDFYEVYAINMRNLGTPVFPKRLFAELLDAFPDSSDILLVRHGSRVAGATLNFYFRDTVVPNYGCADARLHHTGVSTFMYWELMRTAATRGYTRFDFGRSKLGSGSWAFKRGWRMQEQPLPYRYLLVRARHMPNLNPTNPKFRLAIGAWKHLPIGVTKVVGPLLVRGIP